MSPRTQLVKFVHGVKQISRVRINTGGDEAIGT